MLHTIFIVLLCVQQEKNQYFWNFFCLNVTHVTMKCSQRWIPKCSYVKKETVGVDFFLKSRNVDRKIKLPIKIVSRSSSRAKKKQCSQIRWTSYTYKIDTYYPHFHNEPRFRRSSKCSANSPHFHFCSWFKIWIQAWHDISNALVVIQAFSKLVTAFGCTITSSQIWWSTINKNIVKPEIDFVSLKQFQWTWHLFQNNFFLIHFFLL